MRQYSIAVLLTVAGVTLALLIRYLFGINPAALIWLAILGSAWFGGRYPGLLSCVIASLAIDYFFEEPQFQFSPPSAHVVRLTVFCTIALLTSSRRSAETRLTYRETQQAAVAELGRRALSGMPVAQLLDLTTETVRSVLGVRYAAICTVLPAGDKLAFSAASGFPDDVLGREIEIDSDSSLAGRVLRTGSPVVVSDLRMEPSHRPSAVMESLHVRSLIGVSIRYGDTSIGVLGAFERAPRSFSADDADFLQAAANIIAEAAARSKAEEDSRERRNWLDTTLRSIGDGVIATDNDGMVALMNPVAESLTGWSESEARGRPLKDIFHIVDEGSRLTVPNPVDEVLETGGIVGLANHTILLARDGREIPISDSAAPIKDGDSTVGVVLVFYDVSERKRAEAMSARRSREIAALYSFTDRVQRSRSMEDVYEAALDSIFLSLDCDRASVLLFDETESMKFVASRGLSERYRRAASGHSPWAFGEKNAKPIGIANVEEAELDRGLYTAIRNEGIAALGFLPLVSAGRLIGKMMVYYDSPHDFSEAEFDIAMTVANQIATGLERRRTEHKLFENEERLRLATQTGKVGVWDWDIRADRVEWTDAIYTMHGVPKGEYDGTVDSFAALVHPDDRDLIAERIRKALDGEADYEAEFRIVRPDGSIGWLFTNAFVLRDENGPYRMVGATTDFTERKAADQVAARLAAIVSTSRDAIISKDLDGIITSWNQGAENLFGYSADEVIGQPITILIPDERIDEEPAILDRIRNGVFVPAYETVRKRKDGTLIDVSLTVSPLLDSEGRTIGASKIVRDIAERRQAEAARREREIMVRLVEAQEAERQRIARDLHDHLGQRMTALRFKIEGLSERGSESPELTKAIDEIQEFALRIDKDIAFLSWELRPTELAQLGLENALASFVREWSNQHNVSAEFHADPASDPSGRLPETVETNLYRIVQEGLNNIQKHAKARSVNVLLQHRREEIILVIEDDGTGFQPESESGNGQKPGGLGLIGMKERAALLKGSLEIESQPGEGTSIFVRIPRLHSNGAFDSDDTGLPNVRGSGA